MLTRRPWRRSKRLSWRARACRVFTHTQCHWYQSLYSYAADFFGRERKEPKRNEPSVRHITAARAKGAKRVRTATDACPPRMRRLRLIPSCNTVSAQQSYRASHLELEAKPALEMPNVRTP